MAWAVGVLFGVTFFVGPSHSNPGYPSLYAAFFSQALMLSNYKSRIIRDIGLLVATCWSNIKEDEALERYKLITGNTIEFPEFQVYGKMNPEDSWLAASPDGLVNRFVYGLPPGGVLEIKCPYVDGKMIEAFPWKRIPLYCIPQAQGLMEIMDREWMDLYVWTLNGSSLFRIYRDMNEITIRGTSPFSWTKLNAYGCCKSSQEPQLIGLHMSLIQFRLTMSFSTSSMADLPSFSTEEFYWLASCFWGIITCKLWDILIGFWMRNTRSGCQLVLDWFWILFTRGLNISSVWIDYVA
ncbi:hypothetical protein J1N35_036087 [Gossypium stocksii]|uniref:YqaJ viral recombinase domain-containing protein n=1 Tax=Gossypium stocksii TaxID=47602 RepID=A0A9D3UV47_9ROSI|nr:hypothetical protein J1N35_036087 [Gossypium stocksii]